MPEFGLLSGLSADGQYDQKINDLRYQNAELERAKAKAAASAKMFADDYSQGPVGSQYDDPIIRDYTIKKMHEAANIVKNDPNWKYNPTTLGQLKLIKDDLKGNEHVLRAVSTIESKKRLKQDLSEAIKNPNFYNKEGYDKEIQKAENYDKYGHEEGPEGFQREGAKAYIYRKPQDFIDDNELIRKIGSSIQPKGLEDLKNGRDGAYRTYALKQDLENEAQNIYLSHKDQFDQKYTRKGINPIKAISENLNNYVPIKFDIGEKNKLGEQMALAKYEHGLKMALETPGASPFKITVLNSDYSKPPGEDLAATFGSKIPHYLPPGKDGKPIDNTGDDFNYTGDIYDKGYRKDGKYKKTGIKTVDGYVYKPLEFGKEVGYTKDPWGFGEDEVLPEYKDKVEIVDSPMSKDGKSTKMLRIKTHADVNANDPTYQGKWDKNISTTKQREGFGINESMISNGTFKGLPIGGIVERNGQKYLVTNEGLVAQ